MEREDFEKYYDTYKEINSLSPFKIRALLRNIALNGLSFRDKIIGTEKYLNKPRVQFLYFHHIFKDELENFEKLLSELNNQFTFISYSDAVNKVLNGDIDKPYLSISSDDGFKSNLLSLDILRKFNAKACFFINPSLIGETNFEKIKKHCGDKLNFPPVEFLTWDDIEKMQKYGHEIGSHTMSHMDISKESDIKIVDDLNQSFEIIKSKCGSVFHFAFPYGRFFNFNDFGRKSVFDAGFISCATAERGCHINHSSPLLPENFCIRRDHIVLDWNINHILYFLTTNSKKANVLNNLYPY